MITIFCALRSEALPLISKLKLKPYINNVFKNNQIVLTITGVGPANCKNSINKMAFKNSQYINIGVCGCKDPKYKKGSLFLINKIYDNASNRYSYPDMLLKSDINEADITSFTQPNYNNNISTLLADMESYTFYSTAAKYTKSSNIHILKTVSDYMMDKRVTSNDITQYISANIDEIVGYIENLQDKDNKSVSINEEYFDLIVDKYRFSATVKSNFRKMLKFYLLKNSDIDYGKLLSYDPPKSKKESMRIFYELKNKLQ